MKLLRITLEGKSYDVGVEVLEETVVPHVSQPALATAAPFATSAPKQPPAVASGGGHIVSSPMTGLVFKCLVKPGDMVKLNQVVLILDAMKMETPVSSTAAGRVSVVLVKEGDAVGEGEALLQIEGGSQ
ncbi:MAG: hypothetical protein PHN84_09595 [Desulfuromonadaceae bacterium]|nr:hypothetical protein [Desulfuromonadaceae bacterium]MDD2853930.1 hypothetical protein [Desulfuromonadaceae bacterium]